VREDRVREEEVKSLCSCVKRKVREGKRKKEIEILKICDTRLTLHFYRILILALALSYAVKQQVYGSLKEQIFLCYYFKNG
jgi:hypothetical protein